MTIGDPGEISDLFAECAYQGTFPTGDYVYAGLDPLGGARVETGGKLYGADGHCLQETLGTPDLPPSLRTACLHAQGARIVWQQLQDGAVKRGTVVGRHIHDPISATCEESENPYNRSYDPATGVNSQLALKDCRFEGMDPDSFGEYALINARDVADTSTAPQVQKIARGALPLMASARGAPPELVDACTQAIGGFAFADQVRLEAELQLGPGPVGEGSIPGIRLDD